MDFLCSCAGAACNFLRAYLEGQGNTVGRLMGIIEAKGILTKPKPCMPETPGTFGWLLVCL